MKRFLLLTSLFLLLMIAALMIILSRADCGADEFYCRFTSPVQQSIILGTSRSAQGLDPEILGKLINHPGIFNYSFTNEHSPYGKVYLESVEKKLDENSVDGIFILSVDPWCLGAESNSPNDESLFRENDLMLNGMWSVNSNPNFLYLLKYYDGSYYDLLSHNSDGQLMLQKNGWLKVNVPMDSASVSKRTSERIRLYREETAPKYLPSETRFSYLKKMIDMLDSHGEVYLVRLPVSSEMLKLENEYFPQFNEMVAGISQKSNVPYIDLTPVADSLQFTDGNHIAQSSVAKVCELLSARINSH